MIILVVPLAGKRGDKIIEGQEKIRMIAKEKRKQEKGIKKITRKEKGKWDRVDYILVL